MPYSRARIHRRTSFGRKAGGRKTYRRRSYAKATRGRGRNSIGYAVSTRRKAYSAGVATGYTATAKTSKGEICVPFVSSTMSVWNIPTEAFNANSKSGLFFTNAQSTAQMSPANVYTTFDLHPVISLNGSTQATSFPSVMGPQISTVAQGYQHWKVKNFKVRFRSNLPTSSTGIIGMCCYPDPVNLQDVTGTYVIPNFSDVSTLNGSTSGPIWAAELICKGNYAPGLTSGKGKGWFCVDQYNENIPSTISASQSRQNCPMTIMVASSGVPPIVGVGGFSLAVQVGIIEMTGTCCFKDLTSPNLSGLQYVPPTGNIAPLYSTPSSASAALAQYTETLTDGGTDCTAAAPLGTGSGSFVVTGAPNLVSSITTTKLSCNPGTYECAFVWNGATIAAAPTATASTIEGFTPCVISNVLAFYTSTQAIVNFQMVISSQTNNLGILSSAGTGVVIGGLTSMTVAGCTIDITQIA